MTYLFLETTMTIRTTVQALIVSLLVACIVVFWPLTASAASKQVLGFFGWCWKWKAAGLGTKNVQSNSAKRGTANSPLSNAGTAGAAGGAAGGGGSGKPGPREGGLGDWNANKGAGRADQQLRHGIEFRRDRLAAF
jgi:hypothetical protein